MRYDPIDSSFFAGNREKLRKRLDPNSLVIVNANDEMPRNGDQCYPFRQHSDLFYLTGIEQEQTVLILSPDASEIHHREILLILKSSKELETWDGHKLTLQEAQNISGIHTILYVNDFDHLIQSLQYEAENIYLNNNEYPKFLTSVPSRDHRLAMKLTTAYPLQNYRRLAPIMWELRSVKEPEELGLIKKACEITKTAFERVLREIKPGVYEYQIEAELNYVFSVNGGTGPAYQPIVASGKNACTLHYVTNNDVCQNGELVLLDFGVEYANYASDCSRTIPVNGKFTNRQRDCYNAVLRVFKKARNMLVPGNTIRKVNKAVNQLIEDELIGLGLLTAKEVNQASGKELYLNYFMHGTSHFMGLDVHDPGGKDLEFKKGMVLTCEPGIYIKEEGIGIRIENDILVDDVPIDLMENIPLEIEELEAFMKK